MGDMGYGYGSEWHLLRMLGRHRHHLNRQIEQLPELQDRGAKVIDWLDFGFHPTHWTLDGEILGVDFLRETHPAVWEAWFEYWPDRKAGSRNPPNWDAVAKIRIDGIEEYLLVEAKAHVEELSDLRVMSRSRKRSPIAKTPI